MIDACQLPEWPDMVGVNRWAESCFQSLIGKFTIEWLGCKCGLPHARKKYASFSMTKTSMTFLGLLIGALLGTDLVWACNCF